MVSLDSDDSDKGKAVDMFPITWIGSRSNEKREISVHGDMLVSEFKSKLWTLYHGEERLGEEWEFTKSHTVVHGVGRKTMIDTLPLNTYGICKHDVLHTMTFGNVGGLKGGMPAQRCLFFL